MSRASRPRWPLAIAAAAVLVAAIAAAAVLPGSASPPAAGHAVASLATIAGEVCSPAAATAQGMVPDGLASGPNGGFYVSVADQVHSEVCHVSASGAVSLAAGDGTPGYLPAPYGDATAATGAELYNPAGLAFDGGELYIADRFNNRVRLVDTSGVITTVAGDGASGGPLSAPGPATSVALDRPSAVVVSSSGDVYVADSSANEVLELSPSGRLSVFAGTGVAGYSGDGGPATQAELSFPTA
ncbi:MAG: NHL domain-containing protein, partial [Acidimicrobiales bacterium]